MQNSIKPQKQKIYDLTTLSQSSQQLQKYQRLVNLLTTQIRLLQKKLSDITSVLKLFETTAANLASVLIIEPYSPLSQLQTSERIKSWLQIMEKKVIDLADRGKEEQRSAECAGKVLKVQCPVFVQKIIEKYVERVVFKQIEKPLYIERVVEMPIFIQKKSTKNLCIKCVCSIN